MNLKEKHIKFLILLVCIWIGIGAESAWGVRGIAIVLGTGMLWIWSNIQQRLWLGGFCFLSLIIISIGGLVKSTQEVIFISGMVGTLVVWDLERLVQRLKNKKDGQNQSALVHKHFVRLGKVLVSSLTLFFIAFQIDIQLQFWYAMPLIGSVLVGFGYILRNHKDSVSSQEE